MQHHQRAERAEDDGRREMRHHEREREREHGREQPVREAPEGLSLRAQLLRENLGDEHPDDRTLPECVRDDEEEDARRRKKAEEIATIKAQADADKAALNVKLLDDKTFNTMRAGIVLSWYIAGIDGNISKDEERAVTQRIRNIRQTGDIPEKYRDALAELEGYRPMTFDEVKVYLDRADNKALVSLTLRAEYIAKMDGLSAVEKSAIDGVKLYVARKEK